MGKRIPKFISNQYAGGASGFRSNKRAYVRDAIKAVNELSAGCAYFPCGPEPVTKVRALLDEIRQSISCRNWGK